MIKLIVETHDGGKYEAEVESYDAAALNADLNDSSLNTVVLGDLVVSRINVKSVRPVEGTEEVSIPSHHEIAQDLYNTTQGR